MNFSIRPPWRVISVESRSKDLADQGLDDLGILAFAEGGRPDQIGEQDRRELTLPSSRRRNERLRTAGAEPRLVWVLSPA